jgi:hypothetical protein
MQLFRLGASRFHARRVSLDWRRLALVVALFELSVLAGMLITPQLQLWLPGRVVYREDRGKAHIEAMRQMRMSLGDLRQDPKVGAPAPPPRLQDASGKRTSTEPFKGQRIAMVFAEGST